MNEIRAFTVKYQGIVTALKTTCRVCEVYDPFSPSQTEPLRYSFKALDTGATRSVISTRVVDSLGLEPARKTKVFQIPSTHDTDYVMEVKNKRKN
jgi:predicted aspartyl protease